MYEIAKQCPSPCREEEDNGALMYLQVKNQSCLGYYLFLPPTLSSESQVMVCIHGISRNAEEQIKAFSEQAARHDFVIIAPRLRKKDFGGYQRLEKGEAGYTPVDALDMILQDVEQIFKVNTSQFSLFGYSGGAQFAHRYALFYPQRLNKLVICAAGWFTFPDPDEVFPYGLKNAPENMPDLSQTVNDFLSLPIRVLVGEYDKIKDPGLNRRKRINHQQGYHRLDRAKRWLNAIQQSCDDKQIDSDLRFITIRACGHSFENCARLGDLSQYMFTIDS